MTKHPLFQGGDSPSKAFLFKADEFVTQYFYFSKSETTHLLMDLMCLPTHVNSQTHACRYESKQQKKSEADLKTPFQAIEAARK